MNTTELIQWITAGLTGAAVVVAAYYSYLTHRIAKANETLVAATQKQVEAATRPQIVVTPFLLPKNVVVYLRIRNTGQSAAVSLQLKLDRSFFRYGRKEDTQDLFTYHAFQHPIATFPPDAELTFALAQSFIVFGEQADPNRTPPVFAVTATFTHGGRTIEETTQVDLRPFLGSDHPKDPIVEALSAIAEAIKNKG